MKRRVGIDLAPAASPAPGTARHVTEQARALLKLDVDWTWVPTVESRQNPLWSEIEAFSPVVVPGRKLWTRATFQVGAAWERARCDLGFATAYFVPWRGIPVVANFFDSNIYEHFDTWVNSGRRWNAHLIRALSTHAVRRSQFLLVNSHYCADFLRRKFPHDAAKFQVTPPGITPPLPLPDHAPPWAAVLKKPFFLYVGVFSENKNQRRLVEAWSLMRQGKAEFPSLLLIGACDPQFHKRSMKPALDATPHRDEILLPGKVSDAELAWAYHHALAYVQPSIAEGFGLPVLEAMSYGLPVACSQTTSLPETAGGAARLFDPFSVASIAEALQTLACDPDERERLKLAGAKRWRQFTWEANAERVAAQIEGALSRIPKL